MKEHKKLYKSGKNWLVATLTVAAIGVFSNGLLMPTAHADSNNSTPVTTTTNQSLLDQEKAAVTSAQNDVNTAQNAVDTAQSDVNSKVNAVTQANNHLQELQKNKQVTQSDITNAQQIVKKDQEELKKNQANVKIAKNTNANATTNLDNTSKQVNDAQQQVNQTNSALTAAQTAEKNALTKLNNAKAQYNNINQGEVEQSIDLPTGFDQAAYDFYNGNDSQKQAAAEKLAELGQQGLKTNNYKHSNSDEKVLIADPLNLDRETLISLSLYTAKLLNQLRSQLPISSIQKNVQVSGKGIDMAQVVADHYNQDNWNIATRSHDINAINAGNQSANLRASMECASYGYLNNIQNLDDLKEGIYNTILSMLFKDAGTNNDQYGIGGHAASLLGLKGSGMDYLSLSNDANDYIAIDTTHTGDLLFETLRVGPNHSSLNPDGSIHVQIGTANADTIQAFKDAIISDPTTNKDQALTQAKNKIKEANDKYQQQVGLVKTANENLTQAKNNLAKAQQQASQAKESQKQAQHNLEQAQNDLSKAQTQLKNDSQKLQDLTAALNNSEAYHKLIIAAQETVKQTKQALTQSQQTLEQAKKVLAQKQALLNAAKQALANTEQQNNGEANNTSKTNTDQPSDINTATNNTNDYTGNNEGIVANANNQNNDTKSGATIRNNNVLVNTSTTFVAANNEHANNSLPQTGDENESSIIALGVLASMFGLGLITKKRY